MINTNENEAQKGVIANDNKPSHSLALPKAEPKTSEDYKTAWLEALDKRNEAREIIERIITSQEYKALKNQAQELEAKMDLLTQEARQFYNNNDEQALKFQRLLNLAKSREAKKEVKR